MLFSTISFQFKLRYLKFENVSPWCDWMFWFVVGAFHLYSQNLQLILDNANLGKDRYNMDIVHSYTAAVRGYHYHKQLWNPVKNGELHCSHEEFNLYDKYAIKVIHKNGMTVGHLPWELSWVKKFSLDRGVTMYVKLLQVIIDNHPWFKEGWKFLVPWAPECHWL